MGVVLWIKQYYYSHNHLSKAFWVYCNLVLNIKLGHVLSFYMNGKVGLTDLPALPAPPGTTPLDTAPFVQIYIPWFLYINNHLYKRLRCFRSKVPKYFLTIHLLSQICVRCAFYQNLFNWTNMTNGFL